MYSFKNAMEIFKLLDKSNCRKCYEPTCLAFAGAVLKGRKRLDECPSLPLDVIEQFRGDEQNSSENTEQNDSELVESFRQSLEKIDLQTKAPYLGGIYSDNRLTIKVMGKNVSVDKQGKIYTDIHANQWLIMPLLNYIVQSPEEPVTANSSIDSNANSILENTNHLYNKDNHISYNLHPVSANWVPFRELPNGRAWQGLFQKQCEDIIKKVADTYPRFFEQILELFNGKAVEKHYKSDISLVLHPFPKIPILICYWLPDDGIDSDLHLFFDASTEKHLHINSIYALGAGLARMFERIALRHGF